MDQSRHLKKSANAFRTISEVAGELDLPQHVLRFWETKFNQIKPMKRGGGRRYYRPEDVQLLDRIRGWLYDDGYTIKGVQKLLREGEPEDGMTDGETMAPETEPAGLKSGPKTETLQAILSDLKEIRARLG